jgi:diguanylate cyclase (GGDEF)-like protein
MKHTGVWAGRGLAVLGLAAVVWAVSQANLWALLAAIGGFLAATGLAFAPLLRVWLAERPATRPSDFEHTIDLLRRAHGARAGWVVGLEEGDIEVTAPNDTRHDILRRGAAVAQLASVDGRAHVVREPEGTYVGVGDFPFGAALLLARSDATPEDSEAVADDLRRLVASLLLAQRHEPTEPAQLVAKQLAVIVGGAQTLEGIAKAGAALAQQFVQRGVVIALQGVGPATGEARIVAVSTAADSRLEGLSLAPDGPAMRAIAGRVPVVSQGREDVLGSALSDRRRQDRAGTAYPLLDGHFAIGVLVVMGPPLPGDTRLADQLQRLAVELGARLAAARAVHEAEQRAVSDPLTGLRNRREFDRAVLRHAAGKPVAMATLIYCDLDYFKKLNDTLGHAAGDAALRHVARILEGAVRDKDLVARIGGEEFAIWMPHAPLESGLEVAARIRATVESAAWRWDGEEYPLTISCGVASYPDTVTQVENLRSTADAALYRAKQSGRNRVEKAIAAG